MDNPQVVLVYLKAEPGLIEDRLSRRKEHYLAEDLMASQFEALEEPENALTVLAAWKPEKIIDRIHQQLEREL